MLVTTKIRVALVTALSVLAVVAFVPSASAIADRDCGDFNTWRAAQKFFKKNGGPKRDAHRLDADNDGIACEELR